jgi:parvulin-like peptidyl-prolyl isomerase
MKLRICLLVLAATTTTQAQIASHGTTNSSANTETTVVTAGAVARPVVRVNGTVLTDRDLVREMMNVFPYAKQHGGRFPKDSETKIRQTAIKNIEFEELAYQAASKQGMTVSPSKLARAMKDFRAQFESQAQYQEFLKVEQKGSEQDLSRSIRRSLLIDQYLVTEVDNKARYSDAMLLAYYQKHPDQFRKPDSVSIQTITIAYGQTPTPTEKQAARKKAEEALKQAKAAKNYEEFGMLAEKVSMDDWHVMMGDHKWLHRGRMPAAVEKVVFTLKPGEITGIIDTEDSFCIARVNGREDAHLVKFEEVKPRLKKELEAQKAEELRAAVEKRLRTGAKIEEL